MGRSRPVKESSTKTNPSTTIETASKLEKLQKSIEELQKVNNDMAKEIKELKETFCGQNKIIVDLLSEMHVLFPLKSKSEMDDIELEISDENMEAMTHTIKKIVGRNGIKKMLTAIFDKHLLLEFNVDGRQNKKRLLDYPKLINLIYKCVYKDEMLTKKAFYDEIRKGIRLAKNRHYKEASFKKISSLD
ncbi:uncharacterized protein LOC119601604 [Lucilia sericata]|uniref:uncharacterized protein LOC119601604 n=1 Tax=Lucilia sericata TaxID=13632 RepID=UPI0018A7F37C|nr:uncharacterized protein LOC119601604 [Lucilia sericata]